MSTNKLLYFMSCKSLKVLKFLNNDIFVKSLKFLQIANFLKNQSLIEENNRSFLLCILFYSMARRIYLTNNTSLEAKSISYLFFLRIIKTIDNMSGLYFTKFVHHQDLRILLTDYDFRGQASVKVLIIGYNEKRFNTYNHRSIYGYSYSLSKSSLSLQRSANRMPYKTRGICTLINHSNKPVREGNILCKPFNIRIAKRFYPGSGPGGGGSRKITVGLKKMNKNPKDILYSKNHNVFRTIRSRIHGKSHNKDILHKKTNAPITPSNKYFKNTKTQIFKYNNTSKSLKHCMPGNNWKNSKRAFSNIELNPGVKQKLVEQAKLELSTKYTIVGRYNTSQYTASPLPKTTPILIINKNNISYLSKNVTLEAEFTLTGDSVSNILHLASRYYGHIYGCIMPVAGTFINELEYINKSNELKKMNYIEMSFRHNKYEETQLTVLIERDLAKLHGGKKGIEGYKPNKNFLSVHRQIHEISSTYQKVTYSIADLQNCTNNFLPKACLLDVYEKYALFTVFLAPEQTHISIYSDICNKKIIWAYLTTDQTLGNFKISDYQPFGDDPLKLNRPQFLRLITPMVIKDTDMSNHPRVKDTQKNALLYFKTPHIAQELKHIFITNVIPKLQTMSHIPTYDGLGITARQIDDSLAEFDNQQKILAHKVFKKEYISHLKSFRKNAVDDWMQKQQKNVPQQYPHIVKLANAYNEKHNISTRY